MNLNERMMDKLRLFRKNRPPRLHTAASNEQGHTSPTPPAALPERPALGYRIGQPSEELLRLLDENA